MLALLTIALLLLLWYSCIVWVRVAHLAELLLHLPDLGCCNLVPNQNFTLMTCYELPDSFAEEAKRLHLVKPRFKCLVQLLVNVVVDWAGRSDYEAFLSSGCATSCATMHVTLNNFHFGEGHRLFLLFVVLFLEILMKWDVQFGLHRGTRLLIDIW